MKYHKEKKCPFCNEWQVYDRTLHHFSCPKCISKPNTYLKQIRHEQKKLARMIFEMVINFTEEDILRFRNTDIENYHHCQHCNPALPQEIDPVSTIPVETQTKDDPGIGRRRRGKHC